MSEKTFQCDMCGCCCQSVGSSVLYKYLDRGDGTCRYYEDETHKCSIYATRPLLCNIDAYYDKYVSGKMSRSEFHELNHIHCSQLKKRKGDGM